MNIKISLATIFLTILVSCSNSQDNHITASYKDGKQIPILDSSLSTFSYSAPDTVLVETEYWAKILLTKKNQTILKSYVDGDFNNSLVDTTKQILDNCRYRIMVKNDTTHFATSPTDSNLTYNFRIGILTIDENKIYHLNLLRLKFWSGQKTYR